MQESLKLKLKEAFSSVIPITAIVLILSLTIAPMPLGTLSLFLFGAILLIVGMGLFTLGADVAMMPMGEQIGAHLTKSRNLKLLIFVAFLIGTMITMAEPDLVVLANQVPSIPDAVIIGAVAIGVGIFLVIALLRIVFQIKIAHLFIFFYACIFILAIFSSENFLPVAFDSGGVTTGPITVPFIMALGIGVASVRGGKNSRDDSFGLVGLCSVGPILAVLILGFFLNDATPEYSPIAAADVSGVRELFSLFLEAIPHYAKEVLLALGPILVAFLLFQSIFLKLPKSRLLRIGIGVLYTYVGLVLFLTGVNVGFMPAGHLLGHTLASLEYNWIIIPLGMIIGFFIVAAEPAVHVLNQQVEEISGGAIPKKAMMISLCIGVAASIGLSMIRILTGLSIWYFILPGYAIAIGLTFVVPNLFTAIAFDSGGVASGPMTATFLLPFAMGACEALGGNIMTDAFGIIAMVAMTPLITIQIMGLSYTLKLKRLEKAEAAAELPAEDTGEKEIIEF